MPDDLQIDTARLSYDDSTGVYIRAMDDTGKWCSIDIACLTKASLAQWLAGNDQAHNADIVGILLGHGHLRGG